MRPPRVLVVEDDGLNLKLTEDVLRAHGYETCGIGDGRLVLDSALEFQPDLVIVDIGIPGKDGVEATRQLKADARTATIPVLAVTAYAMPEDEMRAREAGCDGFLTKPVRLQELVERAEALLRPIRRD